MSQAVQRTGEGSPAGHVLSGMAMPATFVTSSVPPVPRSTEFCPLLWQDFACGLPGTN
jgi:hypothetical protein